MFVLCIFSAFLFPCHDDGVAASRIIPGAGVDGMKLAALWIAGIPRDWFLCHSVGWIILGSSKAWWGFGRAGKMRIDNSRRVVCLLLYRAPSWIMIVGPSTWPRSFAPGGEPP